MFVAVRLISLCKIHLCQWLSHWLVLIVSCWLG